MAPKKVQSTVKNYEAGIHKFFSIDGATSNTSLNQLTNSTLIEVFRITEGKIITNNLTISGGVNFTDGNIVTSNLIVSGNIKFNNTSLKNNIQVTPLRQVFNVQADTQSLFTLSTEGIYGGQASNAQVFIGQRLLRYYDSNIKDYDLTILRNVDPPITNYTINLAEPAVLGNYVDITIFPQLLPESTPQGFVYQNVVLDAESFTTFAKNGSQIYYNNGNVGIGTVNPTQKLYVEGDIFAKGNVTCSNISVIGDFVRLDTITSNTEQMVIENAGTGPALKVTQTGNNSVAEFYDKESGVALFVGNGGNIGIGTNNPQQKFHIEGNVYLNGNISADNLGMFRNKIINGDMRIAQRGTTFTNISGGGLKVYTMDRWWFAQNATAGNTISQLSSGLNDILYCTRLQRPNANTSTNGFYFGQAFESIESAPFKGQTITVSFYMKKGSDLSSTIILYITSGTGNDENALNVAGGTWSGNNHFIIYTLQTSDITTSWQRFSIYGIVPINCNQLSVMFVKNNTGTAGANDYIDITGVQLEKGNSVTPFEVRPYGMELQLCQYYYQQFNYGGLVLGSLGATGFTATKFSTTDAIIINIPLARTMRIAPNLNLSTSTVRGVFNTAVANVTYSSSYSTPSGPAVIAFVNNSIAAGFGWIDSLGIFTLNAEL